MEGSCSYRSCYVRNALTRVLYWLDICLFFPASTRFVPNQRYIYRYVATTVTGVTGTTNQTTGLRIEATCEINALADCHRSLWVCYLFCLLKKWPLSWSLVVRVRSYLWALFKLMKWKCFLIQFGGKLHRRSFLSDWSMKDGKMFGGGSCKRDGIF